MWNGVNLDDVWAQLEPTQSPIVSSDDNNCSSCGAAKTFFHGQLPVCTECGLMDQYFLSDEPEWISGENDSEDPSRCGMVIDTVLFSDKWGMSTKIVGGKSNHKMAQMNLHSSMNHRDRALYHAYAEFDRIGKSILGLSDLIMNNAKIHYKKFTEEKLTRGDIRIGVKAHCILLACKQSGVSRSLQEIANAYDVHLKDISRTSEMFTSVVGESVIGAMSSDLVTRLFSQIDDFPNKNKVKMKTIRACEDAQKNPLLMSKTPKGVASAVIYLTLIENGCSIERYQIADICKVSLPTLLKIEKIIKNMGTV